jgi:BirA family biotin operon repressor/biotin-[acetyl-CoA-carboxylase] ligase
MSHEHLMVVGNVDPAGRAAVNQLLNERVIESAWYGESTLSTNSLALEQSASDSRPACPRLVLTDAQTAGRGRRGRHWLSSDQTLTFSLVLDGPAEPRGINMLSLAVGVGIARSLEFDFAPLLTRLKWPNDVYVGGGKVAGILLETAGSVGNSVIAGIGLNVGAPPELSDSLQAAPACSLNQATGRNLKRYDCFVSLVQHLVTTLRAGDDVADEFRSRCMLSGEMIRFQEGSVDREGLCMGIDDHGELIVQLETETRTLRSGEVQMIRQRKKTS